MAPARSWRRLRCRSAVCHPERSEGSGVQIERRATLPSRQIPRCARNDPISAFGMTAFFPFDPDIARASTIPARLYIDPVYLELERERVFAHSWQLVGRAEQVAESGEFFTAEVGDDSIVILRDRDTLRGFHNVCLHR